MSLALSVKRADDTADPSELVPSLLVFRVTPRLPVKTVALLEHVQRMKALVAARKEIFDIVAKLRLTTKLKKLVPIAADAEICVLHELLNFSEKPVGKRVRPYLVRRFIDEGKILELDTGDCFITTSIDKVKRYRLENTAPVSESIRNGNENDTKSLEQIAELDSILQNFWHKGDNEKHQVENTGIPLNYFALKVIEPNDSRIKTDAFVISNQTEFDGIKRRNI